MHKYERNEVNVDLHHDQQYEDYEDNISMREAVLKAEQEYYAQLAQSEEQSKLAKQELDSSISSITDQYLNQKCSFRIDNYNEFMSESRKVIEQALKANSFDGRSKLLIILEGLIFLGKYPEMQYKSLFVKRLFQISIEINLEKTTLIDILKLLLMKEFINKRAIRRGFERLVREFEDVKIDNPNAQQYIDTIIQDLLNNEMIYPEILSRLPLYFKDRVDTSKLKQDFQVVIKEFFLSHDQSSILDFFKMNQESTWILIAKSVNLALDQQDNDKEAICQLLKVCGAKPRDFAYAYDYLLWNIEEISIDVPNVKNILPLFIARAVYDKCLNLAYISEAEVSDHVKKPNIEEEILISAQTRLSVSIKVNSKMQPIQYYLENIWETSKTNEQLQLKFKVLIGEFIHNEDIEGISEQIRNLRCPYYMHEFIRRCCIVFIEKYDQQVLKSFQSLVEYLKKQLLLNDAQISIGKHRFEMQTLEDLILDNPKGKEIYSLLKI